MNTYEKDFDITNQKPQFICPNCGKYVYPEIPPLIEVKQRYEPHIIYSSFTREARFITYKTYIYKLYCQDCDIKWKERY